MWCITSQMGTGKCAHGGQYGARGVLGGLWLHRTENSMCELGTSAHANSLWGGIRDSVNALLHRGWCSLHYQKMQASAECACAGQQVRFVGVFWQAVAVLL